MNKKIKIYTGNIDCLPKEVNYNIKRLDKLDNHFLDIINNNKIQGAGYLLSKNGKIFANKSMGKSTFKKESLDLYPDFIRPIYSITKVFTAIAIMKLIEDGKIFLEQQVASIIEEFNNDSHKEIQIFHLITHTAGLNAVSFYFLEPYPVKIHEMLEDDSWIKELLKGTLIHSVGSAYAYSSVGYFILGEIIQRVGGESFVNYITNNIIKPLDMKNTFYDVPKELYAKVCLFDKNEEDYLKSKKTPKDIRSYPATGLYSTMEDLQKFGQMSLNNGELNGIRILSRKSVEMMTRNHLDNHPAYHWGRKFKSFKQGLGWSITADTSIASPETYSHEGWGRCALYIDPKEQFITVFFVPQSAEWVPESLINARSLMWSGIN
jgi:CubicO group peptidase (beta-lactamase class C family)